MKAYLCKLHGNFDTRTFVYCYGENVPYQLEILDIITISDKLANQAEKLYTSGVSYEYAQAKLYGKRDQITSMDDINHALKLFYKS